MVSFSLNWKLRKGACGTSLATASLICAALICATPAMAKHKAPPPCEHDCPPQPGLVTIPPADAEFWAGFDAPELSALIAQGMAANQDLASAKARLAVARARLKTANSKLLPYLSAGVNGTKNTTVVGDILQSGLLPSAELDVGYDLDLFGANRATRRGERARVKASAHDLAALRLSLSGEIARAYIALSSIDAELTTLGTQKGLVDNLARLIAIRTAEHESGAFEAGLVVQQQASLLAQLEVLKENRQEILASLAVLIGQEPGQLQLTPIAFNALTLPSLGEVQPSDLLARRPDVLAAADRLEGARFDEKAVRASRLPSVKLSASGVIGIATGGGFAALASAGGTLFAALFQGGAITARNREAAAISDDALAAYRKAQLNGLREAVSGLAAQSSAQARERLWLLSIDAVGRSARVAQAAYLEGEVPINVVTDARANEVASRRALIEARRDRMNAAIDIYRAMGGAPAPADVLVPAPAVLQADPATSPSGAPLPRKPSPPTANAEPPVSKPVAATTPAPDAMPAPPTPNPPSSALSGGNLAVSATRDFYR
jgi:NodT family efflux transporter outer membrane factor (OMF) lipoprotein